MTDDGSSVDAAPRGTAREILLRHGLRAKKSWGQNFLVDGSVQARIVAAAGLAKDDAVVEIGAGLGALTSRLGEAAGDVVAIERDPDLVRVLEEELASSANVRIAECDALEFDWRGTAEAAGRPLIVVGNLPYQITSPLLFALIGAADGGRAIARAVVMVQRELAERMFAKPGTKTYGRLSVMVQHAAAGEILFHVGASSFHPRPSVTSTVLRLVPRVEPLAAVGDAALFAAVVKAAFGTRRKMLRRALEPAFGDEAATRALARAEIEGSYRAEELTVEEFARLANAFAELRSVPRDA